MPEEKDINTTAVQHGAAAPAESLRTTATVLDAMAALDPEINRPLEHTATVAPPDAPSASRAPCLVVLHGPTEGEVIRLHVGTAPTVGRAEGCDIQLRDDGISRSHARLVVSATGVVLQDLGSRNGTFVGDAQVEHRLLASDEIIRLGASTILRFSYLDALEEDLHRRLLSAALRDPLTGLYNRRHFDDRLSAECAASRRHGRPLTLILIDVDNFKSVNDTFGHSTGDRVLKGVAQSLISGSRREDLLFRHGGEEFAVIARETPASGAVILAERIRVAVAEGRCFADWERKPPLRITISLGVAQLGPGMADAVFVQVADRALYQAKRDGKNRFVSHTTPG